MRYIPRNDFVLFRLVDKGIVRGIVVPQISAQGKERIVEAIGPDVKDLHVGDKVYVIGSMNEDLVSLPNEPDLYLTKQSNVVVIVQEDDLKEAE
jgi:hypothetical protein